MRKVHKITTAAIVLSLVIIGVGHGLKRSSELKDSEARRVGESLRPIDSISMGCEEWGPYRKAAEVLRTDGLDRLSGLSGDREMVTEALNLVYMRGDVVVLSLDAAMGSDPDRHLTCTVRDSGLLEAYGGTANGQDQDGNP